MAKTKSHERPYHHGDLRRAIVKAALEILVETQSLEFSLRDLARRAGVKILTFSLGFGPELVGFNDRHGTRWKISAVPLGGYVKFFGDDSEASTPSAAALASMTEEERKGSFHNKKVGARAAIVAAGPIANFILAIVIFTCLFTFFGKPSTTARVDKIEANSAAAAAGPSPPAT